MDGIVDQHSGRKIMFLSTTEISEDKFICFIHQTCFKNMMLEKWKKHFLSTSHCWSKVLMHPWPGLFSRLFYFPAFFVRSKLVPRSKKKQSWETACQWTRWPSYSTADFPKSWKWSPMPWRPISKKLLERPWQWDSYVVQGHIQNTSWPRTTKLVISKKQSTLCIYTYIYIYVFIL